MNIGVGVVKSLDGTASAVSVDLVIFGSGNYILAFAVLFFEVYRSARVHVCSGSERSGHATAVAVLGRD